MDAARATGLRVRGDLRSGEPAQEIVDVSFRDHPTLFGVFIVFNLQAVFIVTARTVLRIFQMGQPRIFFSMGRDGLLPRWTAAIHLRFRTPYVTTILTGAVVAGTAAVTNIQEMVDLTNIGTLFAFIMVAAGVIVLRHTDPGRRRPFRTLLVPQVPILSIATCGYLAWYLPGVTILRFFVWLAAGLVVYLFYGFRHSRLNGARPAAAP